jgi:hypothetical protein
MEYTLMAYAASISDIEECVGCKEEAFASEKKIDLQYLDEDGDELAKLTARQAHRQMVYGANRTTRNASTSMATSLNNGAAILGRSLTAIGALDPCQERRVAISQDPSSS